MNESDTNGSGELVSSQRRLQRPADFTGGRLDSFRQVFLRHGLPGAVLGLLCLAHPEMRALLGAALAPLLDDPVPYVLAGAAIFAGLVVYAAFLNGRIEAAATGWVVYRLFVSLWEEWVFRLAVPYLAAANGADLRTVVIGSNVVFGAMHYFTLRWKWPWCLGACLGGLAFSRLLAEHSDLALIVGVHWVATFFNTPRLPGRSRISPSE